MILQELHHEAFLCIHFETWDYWYAPGGRTNEVWNLGLEPTNNLQKRLGRRHKRIHRHLRFELAVKRISHLHQIKRVHAQRHQITRLVPARNVILQELDNWALRAAAHTSG